MPSRFSKDPHERSLALFVNSVRFAYQHPEKSGGGHHNLTPEMIKVLETIPGWKWNPVDDFVEKCEDFNEYCLSIGKSPSQDSTDPVEQRWGRFAANRRKDYKIGKGNIGNNEECVKVLEKNPFWFWVNTASDKAKQYKEWVSRENRFPCKQSTGEENKIYHFFSKRRSEYKKNKLSKETIVELESIPNWKW